MLLLNFCLSICCAKLNKFYSATNLIDHMMSMMEKYAKNLEKMVESRTEELMTERQRADELLNRMLPR